MIGAGGSRLQMAKHPVPDIFEIGRAGREMIVPSVTVAGDFDLHRGLPGGGGGLSRPDPFERRANQFLVGQHRNLKTEHVGGLAGRPSCEGLDFGQRCDSAS